MVDAKDGQKASPKLDVIAVGLDFGNSKTRIATNVPSEELKARGIATEFVSVIGLPVDETAGRKIQEKFGRDYLVSKECYDAVWRESVTCFRPLELKAGKEVSDGHRAALARLLRHAISPFAAMADGTPVRVSVSNLPNFLEDYESFVTEVMYGAGSGALNFLIANPQPEQVAASKVLDSNKEVVKGIVVDGGHGNVKLLLKQPHYPTTDEQMQLDKVNGQVYHQAVFDRIKEIHPDANLGIDQVMAWDERFSYVTGTAKPAAQANVVIQKQLEQVTEDLTSLMGEIPRDLLVPYFCDAIVTIARNIGPADDPQIFRNNVWLTGRLARIPGIGEAVEAELRRRFGQDSGWTVKACADEYAVAKGNLALAMEAYASEQKRVPRLELYVPKPTSELKKATAL